MKLKPTIAVVTPPWNEIDSILRKYQSSEYNLEIIHSSLLSSTVPLSDIDILIMFSGFLTKKEIDLMENLRFVQMLTAGVDTVNVEELQRRHIPIADNNGTNANSVAEHTVFFILALLRNYQALQSAIKKGHWQGPPPFISELHELQNKTVGIVGLGRIGTLVAEKLSQFNVRLQYADIRRYSAKEKRLSISFLPFNELIKTSDIITAHVPLTNDTKGMFNEKVFHMMKPKSYFVNTSRGSVVITKDLINALANKVIEGAALDVFEKEPLTKSDVAKFSDLPIIITPHRAGSSIENWEERIRFAFENVNRFLKGIKPLAVIT